MRCSVVLVLALLVGTAVAQTFTDCADYCDQDTGFAYVCPTEYAAYFNIGALTGSDQAHLDFQHAACMKHCMAWPTNASPDPVTSGDSLQCRLYHLGAAVTAGAPGTSTVHCGHAAPLSASNTCGNWFESYADLTGAVCGWTGMNATGQFADRADVASQLAYVPTMLPQGADGATYIDTFQCRVYHVLAAASGAVGATPHCAHGARISVTCNSGQMAGSPFANGICDAYCDSYVAGCASNPSFIFPNSLFGGVTPTAADQKAACMATCAHLAPGTAADTSGPTAGCRAYHALVASTSADNAATHCRHAGYGDAVNGGSVCGNSCDFYCSIYTADVCNSTDGNTFDTPMSCGAYCNVVMPNMPLETPLDVVGALGLGFPDDTRTCRAYHATAAYLLGGHNAHCQHANIFGGTYPNGGVCGIPLMTYADLQATTCATLTVASATPPFTVYNASLLGAAVLPEGMASDTTGDTLACRIYHASVATGLMAAGGADNLAQAAAHCGHSLTVSSSFSANALPTSGPCSSSPAPQFGCDYYCDMHLDVCSAVPNVHFADKAACLTQCAAFTPATAAFGQPTMSGNSVDCHFYHVLAAALAGLDNDVENVAAHCGHSFSPATAVCVAPPAASSAADTAGSAGGSMSSTGAVAGSGDGTLPGSASTVGASVAAAATIAAMLL